MGDLRKFKTDASAEEDGQWVDLGDDVRVKVRSERSKKARQFAESHTRKHRLAMARNGGGLPFELRDELEIQLAARVIVVGWEGVEEDGTSVECTPENALRIMREYPALREQVLYAARTDETFRPDGGGAGGGAAGGA